MTQSSEPATPTRGHLTRTLRAAARRPRPDAVLLVAIIALLNAARLAQFGLVLRRIDAAGERGGSIEALVPNIAEEHPHLLG